MSLQDPISDMLTVIRNGLKAQHKEVSTPYSNIKKDILNVLIEEGYLLSFEETTNTAGHKQLVVELKYVDGTPVIRKLNRYSKPSLRKYSSAENIPMVLDGLGVSIISTNQGVMPDYKAKQLNVGGEVICQVE